MRNSENGRGFALKLLVPVLTALSLIFFRILTASSFESTENVALVTVLLAAALVLGVLAAFKDVLHVPSLLTFAALAVAAAAFTAGRASYVAFYLTGDVMNTGLSVFFILTCIALVLAIALSIAAMAAGSRKAR